MLEHKITFDKFIRWTLIAAIVLAVLYVVNYLSGALLPFAVAWLLAYLLYPVVKFVQYRMQVRIRALAISITMLFVAAVIGLVVYFIVPPMIEQFVKLSDVLVAWLQQSANTDDFTAVIKEWMNDHQEEIRSYFRSGEFSDMLKTLLPKIFSVIGYTASIIVSVIASFIALMYTFFILMDYEYLSANWIRIFPKRVRPFWQELMQGVERELNNYMRGQCLVALCMGVMFCVGFSLMNFPMAIGLGILIGIMDLVPYLRALALIPTAFLAMLRAAETGQSFWLVFGIAAGLFVIVQIITDMVVTPRIMGKAMRLNPAILLLALSVWGATLGFIGLIIALPLTTLIIAYWKRYITKEHEEEKATQLVNQQNKTE